MARITYVEKKFRADARKIIRIANQICADYQAQGYDLTLRQLYYQFVARGYLANQQKEYSRLGGIINDARLAGELDWNYIVDRTRNLKRISHWEKPQAVIRSAADAWAIDKWADQPNRVEVWIEKDALVGILDAVCPDEDVPYFSCRGYTSQSEIWGAAQRLGEYIRAGQNVVIVHLGDHDPSGIDMTRDIEDRLRIFLKKDNSVAATRYILDEKGFRGKLNYDENDQLIHDEVYEEATNAIISHGATYGLLTIHRIALNNDQIEQYDPPPNPAKLTDSRARGYIEEYGEESWELDALDPAVLAALIRDAIEAERDEDLWRAAVLREDGEREVIQAIADNWEEVKELVAAD